MAGPRTLKRADFQRLAETRLREAKILLDAGEYDGAHYFAGYAVECALKACICQQYQGHTFPSKNQARGNVYIHDPDLLSHEAELTSTLRAMEASDAVFADYWSVVLRWSEQSRYDPSTQRDAQDLYIAVSDGAHGVLQWLRRYW